MKSKKVFGRILAVSLAAMMIIGCGSDGEISQESTVETSVVSSSKESVEASSTESAPSTEESSEEEKKEIYTPVQNGSYFVAYNDKLYFHAPTQAGMEETALFGEFLALGGGDKALYSIDSLGQVEEELKDFSRGKLYVSGDRMFYTGEYDGISRGNTTIYNLTDSLAQKAADNHAYLMGADEFGEYALVAIEELVPYGEYSYYETVGTAVYKNGEYHKDLPKINGTFLGVAESAVFYIESTEEDTKVLLQMDIETEKLTNLGTLPTVEYGDLTAEDFICENGYVAMAYDAYEGTGHFYSEGFYVQAKVGQPDSLRYEDAPAGENRTPFFFENGTFTQCEGTPYTADTRDDTIGYYDREGKWTPVATGDYEAVFSEDYEQLQLVEYAQHIDGYIYGVRDYMEHVAEDDIGWRTAYRRNKMEIFRVNCETGDEEVILTVER